jgi:hypothetical protein
MRESLTKLAAHAERILPSKTVDEIYSDIRKRIDESIKTSRKSFTKPELIKGYARTGLEFPPDAKWFRIRGGDEAGLYGVQLAAYEQATSIEVLDIIVLLVVDLNDVYQNRFVTEHADFWLDEVK